MSLVCCQPCKVVSVVLATRNPVIHLGTDLSEARHTIQVNSSVKGTDVSCSAGWATAQPTADAVAAATALLR